ncbi:hypothetical protein [Flavobacterium sp.]|jgi:hypothetical protein|uniref:hypothetical protein n=1 Tax=Flavobacterium sp. TaxID=239 RepID=UPI002B9D1D2E|nr:hypothetical protein [Flavobacterium sp.]MCA0348070.1 hypothetical protein [Bacteroidota bacterium]HQA73115.1 hypothetical protein [Flavobacterium sp.]
MKKLFLFIGLVSINFIFAQQNEIDITPNNSWLKAGITAGIPVGDASNFSTFNLGLDLRGQYLFNPNFGIGLASGYTHYFAKNDFDDFGIIPVAGFARYYFTKSGIFIGTDLGYGFLSNVDNNEGGMYLNPHLGYHNRDWNIYAFYQNTIAQNNTNLQSVGVGVTYNIRFK